MRDERYLSANNRVPARVEAASIGLRMGLLGWVWDNERDNARLCAPRSGAFSPAAGSTGAKRRGRTLVCAKQRWQGGAKQLRVERPLTRSSARTARPTRR